jgi:hypothetical protein
MPVWAVFVSQRASSRSSGSRMARRSISRAVSCHGPLASARPRRLRTHLQERDKLAVGDAVATVEQRKQRDHLRPKRSRGHLWRTLSRNKIAIAKAAQVWS